jgi:Peptidase M50B-like
MADVLFRGCCPDRGFTHGYVDPVGVEPTIADPTAPAFPVPPRDPSEDRAMAFHELGHALATILLGGQVGRVAIRPGNPSCGSEGLTGLDGALMALAGPMAEQVARGHVSELPYPEAIIGWFIANKPSGGGCDLCRAFLPLVQDIGFDRREAVIARFRVIEAAAFRLVDHEESRRFFRIAGAELVAAGELSGERVHALADELLDPQTLETLKTIIEME